jgi:hypothetical protein
MTIYTTGVAQKKRIKPAVKTWQPTAEDQQLMDDLRAKLGVTDPAIVRMGIRKLAEAEGILKSAA